MKKYIEADCELIKITYVAENKPENPHEQYILATDLKEAINILKAHFRDANVEDRIGSGIIINKAEYVSSIVFCDSSYVTGKIENGF